MADWSAADAPRRHRRPRSRPPRVGAPTTWVLSNHDSPAPRHPLRRRRARPAPGPGRRPADAGAARLGLPLPGRGARPAGGPRPAGRVREDPTWYAPAAPIGPRRLPGAAAVDAVAPASASPPPALLAAAARLGAPGRVVTQGVPLRSWSCTAAALRLRRTFTGPLTWTPPPPTSGWTSSVPLCAAWSTCPPQRSRPPASPADRATCRAAELPADTARLAGVERPVMGHPGHGGSHMLPAVRFRCRCREASRSTFQPSCGACGRRRPGYWPAVAVFLGSLRGLDELSPSRAGRSRTG